MYYFVGYNLGGSITGIEKAMINRLKIFKESGKKARCIFLAWNRFLTKQAESFIEKRIFKHVRLFSRFQKSY